MSLKPVNLRFFALVVPAQVVDKGGAFCFGAVGGCRNVVGNGTNNRHKSRLTLLGRRALMMELKVWHLEMK